MWRVHPDVQCTLITAVAVIAVYCYYWHPEIPTNVQMTPNGLSEPEPRTCCQKHALPCFLSSLGLRPFLWRPGDCHLGWEAEADFRPPSPLINIPSVFQVPFQIPFGEVRKHFMEGLRFISSSLLPQAFMILLWHLSHSVQHCSCIPSVCFTTVTDLRVGTRVHLSWNPPKWIIEYLAHSRCSRNICWIGMIQKF